MSFIGKLHEIVFYGLITNIVCIFRGKVNIQELWDAAFQIDGFHTCFLSYLFWSSVLFIPIAIICAFATKYSDNGEGLTFNSNNIIVILFAHIAEEILGLLLTPFWFLKDLFTKSFSTWKIVDYGTYLAELIFIAYGISTII